jgi:hypothetical protein
MPRGIDTKNTEDKKHNNTKIKKNLLYPNPGTDEAIKDGCQCPIMDNEYGRGYMGMPDVFVYNMECPIHGFKHKRILNHEKK